MEPIKRARPAEAKVAQALRFLSEHFAASSAIVVIVAICFAIVFLGTFLSVFDARLIWLIEYSDVAKIGLIALAFTLAFAAATLPPLINIQLEERPLPIWVLVITPALAAAVMLGVQFIHGELDTNVFLRLVGSLLGISVIAVLIALSVWRLRKEEDLGVYDGFYGFIIIMIASALLGLSYGLLSRTGADAYDVTVSEGDKITHARIIFLTSQYAAFFVQERTVVIPAILIRRIEKRLPTKG
jgi:hypothetical protein